MDVSDELVDVLDNDGKVVATINRLEAERLNHTTSNVLVFIWNQLGELWIQQRARNKRHHPGLWDISACGGIMNGETPLQAALREQQEEMGFTSELEFVQQFFNAFTVEDGSLRTRLSHIFVGRTNDSPKPNEDVEAFRIISMPHLAKELQQSPELYVPSFAAELAKVQAVHHQWFAQNS